MLKPNEFLFYPIPFPTISIASPNNSTNQSEELYLFGFKERNSILISGGIYSNSLNLAQDLITTAKLKLIGTAGENLLLLGKTLKEGDHQIETKLNGKQKQVNDDENWIELIISTKSGLPYFKLPPISSNSSPMEIKTIIIYKIPNSNLKLQFLNLIPLELDLNYFSDPSLNNPPSNSNYNSNSNHNSNEQTILSNKLRQSLNLDFTSPINSNRSEIINLKQVIDWINLTPHLPLLLSPSKKSTSTLNYSSHLLLPLQFIFNSLIKPPFKILGSLARICLIVSNWEIPFCGGNALKDLSATVQQLDTRLTQILSWPNQYKLIRHTLDNNSLLQSSANIHSLSIGRAHYIQFYNTLWLIANDMIVGTAFTSFFCENSDYLGNKLGEVIQQYTLTSIKELLIWLNHWPGGVKLNFELASVFSDAFLWGTGLWEEYIFKSHLSPSLPLLIYILGLSGFLGTTMFISFAADLLSILTLHIFLIYFFITLVFKCHWKLLGGMFGIFRGKKFNPLRNRVEPAIYEVDQLLLGTILFTLAAFLFPTVLAYYLTFAASRISIVLLHALMETILAFMNHFPLFAVMLRLKDSARLPGGVQFDLIEGDEGEGGGVGGGEGRVMLRMRNNPLHLVGIFFQHLQLSRRLASHYSPIYLLSKLLTGDLISPIPRVRLRLWVQLDFLEGKGKERKE